MPKNEEQSGKTLASGAVKLTVYNRWKIWYDGEETTAVL